MLDRRIRWDGFHNARDLGGLPTGGGGVTRSGQLIRSAGVWFVTPDGWRAARAHGVRTVVDLRNDVEVADGVTSLDDYGIDWAHVALDGVEDVEFWAYLQRELLDGTPLYFGPFLERKPERVAAAITAIARARPGGLVFHCGAGRDRTGLISMLVLSLAGVDADTITADYELSAQELQTLYAATGGTRAADLAAVVDAMAHHGETNLAVMRRTLSGLDVRQYLLDAGVAATDIDAVRTRLIR